MKALHFRAAVATAGVTALLGLGKDELAKIAREQPHTEATCDFCRRKYVLSADDVLSLLDRLHPSTGSG